MLKYQPSTSNPTQKPPPLPTSLPYQQLTFILTQTIGLQQPSNLKKIQNSHTHTHLPPQHKYKDILIPVSVGSCQNIYLYYLYHVAPVYNWLRQVRVFGSGGTGRNAYQRQMLAKYIRNKIKSKNNSNKSPTNLNPHNPIPSQTSTQSRLHLNQFLTNLLQTSRKYQPAKRSLMSKIHIKNINPSNNTPHEQVCKHQLKLSVYTHSYRYDKNAGLVIESFYCRECERDVVVSRCGAAVGGGGSGAGSKIRYLYQYCIQEYPLAPIFNQYHGQTITIQIQTNSNPTNTNTTTTIKPNLSTNAIKPPKQQYNKPSTISSQTQPQKFKYILTQIYSTETNSSKNSHSHQNQNYILLKAANGLWYKTQPQTIEEVSKNTISKINKKNYSLQTSTPKIVSNIAEYLSKFEKQVISYGHSQKNTHKLNNNNLFVYVHEDMLNNCGILKMAEYKKQVQTTDAKRVRKGEDDRGAALEGKDDQFRMDEQERYEQNFGNTIKNSSNLTTKMNKIKKIQPQSPPQNQNQLLQQLPQPAPTNTPQILLPQSLHSTPSGLKYLEQVTKLYPKQKVKDQYQKDYDKGKTKKIKKKIEYIKPNFNQIFKDVKKDNQEKIQGVYRGERFRSRYGNGKERSQRNKEKDRERDRERNRNRFQNKDNVSSKNQNNMDDGYIPTQKDMQRNKNQSNKDSNRSRDRDRDRDRNRGGRGRMGRDNKGKPLHGNRKAYKQWRKQKKAQFIKKFEQS